MLNMNLREWSSLSSPQRREWMSTKSPKDLVQLLVMVGEMLEQAADMDAELAILIDPDPVITEVRDHTHYALRSVERYVTAALRERHVDIRSVIES